MSENVLRDKMEQLLKIELRTLALHTRAKLDLTQNKMGDRYVMSGDSFSNIESGENMCGTLTTIFLLHDQDDPNGILKDITEKLEKLRREEFLQP